MSFRKEHIDYSQTGFFSKLMLDYIGEKESVRNFYKYSPFIRSFKEIIEIKSNENINRKKLSEILKEQYKNVSPLSPLVINNILLLGKENTFTVTTAHQPNLFTGYLYFFYKIISTINLTEQLKNEYPANNFVPVFWMNTEDHDFAEINHIHLFGKKIEWNTDAVGAVGKIPTASIEPVLNELEQLTEKEERGAELLKLLRTAYLKNKNLAEATRFLVNELFGKYGLLIIDSDDKDLKTMFSGIMKDELENQKLFQLVSETNSDLEKCGYTVQAKPREINLFFLNENSRERIGKLQITNYKTQITENPERFSPNVLLRCLYQEKILPNLAYIGGGGEISYWLQMKKVFEHYGVNFPMLLLRNSVLWVDKNNAERMNKFGFSVNDLFLDTDFLINQFLSIQQDKSLEFDNEKKEISLLMQKIAEKIKSTDSTLEQMVLSEEKKMMDSLENIKMKITKAEKRKHETGINQIKSLKEKLFPAGELQERHDNFIPYYLKYGDEFIKILKQFTDVFEKRFGVIIEESLS